MKTVTMCASMRFEKQMQALAYQLETTQGYVVLQCTYSPEGTQPSAQELQNLEKAHYRKIDLSDTIYVVDIDGYIGPSVSAEIQYALSHGKEVLYHCERNR